MGSINGMASWEAEQLRAENASLIERLHVYEPPDTTYRTPHGKPPPESSD